VAPWWWFPCKPKHVGAVLLILKCFNNSTFFNVVCISWKLKCCTTISLPILYIYYFNIYEVKLLCYKLKRLYILYRRTCDLASYIFPFRSNDPHRLLATAVRCDSLTCFLPKWRHGLMFAAVIVTVRYLTHRPSPCQIQAGRFVSATLPTWLSNLLEKWG